MAFIADRLRRNMREPARTKVKEYFDALEQEIAAPIRLLQPSHRVEDLPDPNENWTGTSAQLDNYHDMHAADFRDRGITINFGSYHVPVTGYQNTAFNDQCLAERWPGYEAYREDNMILWDAISISPEAVIAADGEPLSWDGSVEGSPYSFVWAECYSNGRTIYVSQGPANLFQYGMLNFDEMLKPTLLRGLDPEKLAEYLAERKVREEALFAEILSDRGNQQITLTRTQIGEAAAAHAKASADIVNAAKLASDLQRQLDAMLAQADSLDATILSSEYKRINDNVHVEKVQLISTQNYPTNAYGEERRDEPMIQSGKLIVTTDDLFITNPDNNRTMPLGKFTFTLNFANNEVRIHNDTLRMDNWDHPHVREEGLCTGSFGSAIQQMMTNRELGPMVDMMFHILATVTPRDDWGRAIVVWEEHDDNYRAENSLAAWVAGETEYPGAVPTEIAMTAGEVENARENVYDQERGDEEEEEY